jgi:hypothetical protein
MRKAPTRFFGIESIHFVCAAQAETTLVTNGLVTRGPVLETGTSFVSHQLIGHHQITVSAFPAWTSQDSLDHRFRFSRMDISRLSGFDKA